MPKLGRGVFPLIACVRWYVKFWRDRAQSRTGDTVGEGKKDVELKILRAKYEETTGDLIRRSEVVMQVSSGFVRLGKMLDSIPPSLGREFNLGTDIVRLMSARIDEAREGYVRDVREYIDVVEVEKQQKAEANAKRKKRA